MAERMTNAEFLKLRPGDRVRFLLKDQRDPNGCKLVGNELCNPGITAVVAAVDEDEGLIRLRDAEGMHPSSVGWWFTRFETPLGHEPVVVSDHPSDADRAYYDWLPGVQCNDVVRHFPYNLGAALKYIWRAGRKDGATRESDLRKAIDYLRYELGEKPGERS